MAEYIEREYLLYEFREIMPEMGVDELSVAPSMVLKVRKNIREYTAN